MKKHQEIKNCKKQKTNGKPCQDQCVDCYSQQLRDQLKDENMEMDANKVNAYTCGSCKENTVIKHRDNGVAPFFINCFHCGSQAISHMYKVPQDLEPHLIAFKPKGKLEWKLYKKYLKSYYGSETPTAKAMHSIIESVKNHTKKGGLVMIKSSMLKTE